MSSHRSPSSGRSPERFTTPLAATILAAALVFAAGSDVRAGSDGAPSFARLEQALTCQCGCGLTVHACNHLQCPSAIPLRQEIREQIRLGKDYRAILDHFAAKYGEKILSAPTTRGFNLTAWVTPFLAVTLGAVLVAATLARWRRRTRATAAVGTTPVPGTETTAVPPEVEAILRRELEELDR